MFTNIVQKEEPAWTKNAQREAAILGHAKKVRLKKTQGLKGKMFTYTKNVSTSIQERVQGVLSSLEKKAENLKTEGAQFSSANIKRIGKIVSQGLLVIGLTTSSISHGGGAHNVSRTDCPPVAKSSAAAKPKSTTVAKVYTAPQHIDKNSAKLKITAEKNQRKIDSQLEQKLRLQHKRPALAHYGIPPWVGTGHKVSYQTYVGQQINSIKKISEQIGELTKKNASQGSNKATNKQTPHTGVLKKDGSQQKSIKGEQKIPPESVKPGVVVSPKQGASAPMPAAPQPISASSAPVVTPLPQDNAPKPIVGQNNQNTFANNSDYIGFPFLVPIPFKREGAFSLFSKHKDPKQSPSSDPDVGYPLPVPPVSPSNNASNTGSTPPDIKKKPTAFFDVLGKNGESGKEDSPSSPVVAITPNPSTDSSNSKGAILQTTPSATSKFVGSIKDRVSELFRKKTMQSSPSVSPPSSTVANVSPVPSSETPIKVSNTVGSTSKIPSEQSSLPTYFSPPPSTYTISDPSIQKISFTATQFEPIMFTLGRNGNVTTFPPFGSVPPVIVRAKPLAPEVLVVPRPAAPESTPNMTTYVSSTPQTAKDKISRRTTRKLPENPLKMPNKKNTLGSSPMDEYSGLNRDTLTRKKLQEFLKDANNRINSLPDGHHLKSVSFFEKPVMVHRKDRNGITKDVRAYRVFIEKGGKKGHFTLPPASISKTASENYEPLLRNLTNVASIDALLKLAEKKTEGWGKNTKT